MAKMTEADLADLKARMLGLVGNDSIVVAKSDEHAAALEAELKGCEAKLPESSGAAYLLDLAKLVEECRATHSHKETKAALKKLEEPKAEPKPEPKAEVKAEEPKAEEPKAEKAEAKKGKKAEKAEDKADEKP